MSPVAMGLPRTGWIRGQFDNTKVDLEYGVRPPTGVQGEVDHATVSLNNDSAQSTESGSAYNQQVNLSYKWTPELVHYDGQALNKDYVVDVDYVNHRATGHHGDNAIDLQFDDHSIQGQAGGGDVQVQVTGDGHISGSIDGRTLEGETANVDMGTVASHIFLFAPGT